MPIVKKPKWRKNKVGGCGRDSSCGNFIGQW